MPGDPPVPANRAGGVRTSAAAGGWLEDATRDLATCVYDATPSSGDLNCDGGVNFDDIDCFVAALVGPEAWNQCGHGPSCDYVAANDINRDGAVDFNDIDQFVVCLINGGCP